MPKTKKSFQSSAHIVNKHRESSLSSVRTSSRNRFQPKIKKKEENAFLCISLLVEGEPVSRLYWSRWRPSHVGVSLAKIWSQKPPKKTKNFSKNSKIEVLRESSTRRSFSNFKDMYIGTVSRNFRQRKLIALCCRSRICDWRKCQRRRIWCQREETVNYEVGFRFWLFYIINAKIMKGLN